MPLFPRINSVRVKFFDWLLHGRCRKNTAIGLLTLIDDSFKIRNSLPAHHSRQKDLLRHCICSPPFSVF